MNNASIAGS